MSFVGAALTGGTLHNYASGLVAFEHGVSTSSLPNPSTLPFHTLIFIGGLSDGLLTVPYTTPLSQRLPPAWCLLQPLLASSYRNWGISSLNSDVGNLVDLVAYLRNLRPGGKIVFMGHSTGCQDAMHYLTSQLRGHKDFRPRVDGIVLQAPVSDREGMSLLASGHVLQQWSSWLAEAEALVATSRGEEVLTEVSTFMGAPVCARRWVSLVQVGGEDDYFSSDLKDETLRGTFGKLGEKDVPLLVLFSGDDEFVPGYVDKEALVGRWVEVVRSGGGFVDEGSEVVVGASHALTAGGDRKPPDEVSKTLEGVFEKIAKFLMTMEGRN